jgi:hypothetical protein
MTPRSGETCKSTDAHRRGGPDRFLRKRRASKTRQPSIHMDKALRSNPGDLRYAG